MKFIQDPRSEEEIFAKLEALASKPGYAHAIAFLCFRDNAIKFTKDLQGKDIAKLYSDDRLIRTEISTLIGLLVKGNLNLDVPSPDVMQEMLNQTDQLFFRVGWGKDSLCLGERCCRKCVNKPERHMHDHSSSHV